MKHIIHKSLCWTVEVCECVCVLKLNHKNDVSKSSRENYALQQAPDHSKTFIIVLHQLCCGCNYFTFIRLAHFVRRCEEKNEAYFIVLHIKSIEYVEHLLLMCNDKNGNKSERQRGEERERKKNRKRMQQMNIEHG